MAARVKVIDLAKELGVVSKDVIVALEGMGHPGLRAMSPVRKALANELRAAMARAIPTKPSVPWPTLSAPRWVAPRPAATRTAWRDPDELRPRQWRQQQIVEPSRTLHVDRARLDELRRQTDVTPSAQPGFYCHVCQTQHPDGEARYFADSTWRPGERAELQRILGDRVAAHDRAVCEQAYDLVLAWTRKLRALSGPKCVPGNSCRAANPVRDPFRCRCVCVGANHGVESHVAAVPITRESR